MLVLSYSLIQETSKLSYSLLQTTLNYPLPDNKDLRYGKISYSYPYSPFQKKLHYFFLNFSNNPG